MSYSERASGIISVLADRPVAYHPRLAAVIGVKEAIFVCQLLYWDGKGKLAGDWIFKTQESITEETGMSRYEQETVRKNLVKRGILEEKLRGIPARMHFRLRFDALGQVIDEAYKDTNQVVLPARVRRPNQVWGNPPNRLGETPQTTGGEIPQTEDGGIPQSIPESTTDDLQENMTESCGASAPLPAPGSADLDAAFPKSGKQEAETLPGDSAQEGETAGDDTLTPEQRRLAAAAGLTAAANPHGAGVASPVPCQPADQVQPGDPPWAPAMRRALAGGRGKGAAQLPYGLTTEHIIRVLDRFALLANTTVPTTDASKARGWAKGARDCIEPWAEMVQQAGLPIDPDQVTRLAVWGIDVFFARREAGEFDFTVQSPFSIAGTVRQLTADCKRLQDAAGLLRDQVPEWKESTPDGTPESRKRPGRNGSTRTTGMGGPTAPPIDPDVVARQRQSLLDWQQRKEASDAVAA